MIRVLWLIILPPRPHSLLIKSGHVCEESVEWLEISMKKVFYFL